MARAQEARTAGHVKPLNDLIQRIESEQGVANLPMIDPTFGGVNATVLFVLKAPEGDATPDPSRPQLLSLDNDDPTAADLFQVTQAAGLDRALITPWNISPFPPKAGGDPRVSDVRIANRYHRELFALLPRLRTIVLLGKPARELWPEVPFRGDATILRCGMPSSWNRPNSAGVSRRPEAWSEIVDTMHAAAHSARG
ncbi:hypothetical protein [Nocardia sp. NPDC057353]|uniref:hypothetical protein n=1 Tax=Nocardia sp. NPDC057353 TaxID=3346104 RepID=UPI00364453FB